MKKKFLAIIAGLCGAFAIMMAFEGTNSLFFPFPAGMDLNDIHAVQTFAKTLPWTAYIMVLLGWAMSSIFAGWISTKIAHEKTMKLAITLGIILTLLGIANSLMLEHPIWFNVIGLPLFIPCSILGHKLATQKPSSGNSK
ncbi:MAG: hypothetical protein U0519_04930 [Candidatus Gracilibacteria bacterium]